MLSLRLPESLLEVAVMLLECLKASTGCWRVQELVPRPELMRLALTTS